MSPDKKLIIQILVDSFRDNPSVNFVIKQDHRKEKRIRLLMEYSFFQCEQFGRIYLNEAKNCCALIIEPQRKKFTLQSLVWDIRLAVGCIGLRTIKKVLNREAEIKRHHPEEAFIHLWYVGVKPGQQGNGLGSAMVKRILSDALQENKSIYLETSNPRNFPFYEKLGFEIACDLGNVGYHLRMYRKSKSSPSSLQENA